MTAPTGTNLPVGQFPGIPINPDGTPNFGVAASGGGASGKVDATGALSIWNIPTSIAKTRIWFDIGHPTDLANEDRGGLHPGHLKPVARSNAYQIVRSPQQIMKQFAAMSFNDPNSFFALQKALASGPWGTVNPTGSFDASTEKALGNAMLQYVKLAQGAGVGVSFTDFLLQTGERAQQLGGKGTSLGSGGSQQQQVSLADPGAIRQAAQSAAQAALGMGLSNDQLDKFVAQFQASQTAAQTSTASSSTNPDLSSQAMAFAQQSDPSAYHQNQRQSFVDTLVNMFAPSGSGRPNTAPVASVNAPASTPGGASVRG